MKVLHYVDENKLTWGETWIQLIEELSSRGLENIVVCKSGGTLFERLGRAGVSSYVCDVPISSLPISAMRFSKIISEVSPDIIHTRLSSAARIGGFWGKIKNIPVAETLDKHAKIKYYKDASLLLACSNSVADDIIAQGFPREKVEVVPNPINVLHYRNGMSEREHRRASLRCGKDTKIIVSAGRFDDGKGFEFLIEAFAKIHTAFPDSKLLLLGDGVKKSLYIKTAAEYKISDSVIMPGFVSDIRPWFWASDVFVFPSDGRDAFGLSLLEAMACGLPSVATDVGGPSDIIASPNCGLMVPPSNSSEIARAVLNILTDSKLNDAMAVNSVNRACDFDVSKIAANIISCYNKLLA